MRNKFGREITINDIATEHFWCGYLNVARDVPQVTIATPIGENGEELSDIKMVGFFGRVGSVVRGRATRGV